MKLIQTTGKRKRAIARATLNKGTGKIKINSKDISLFGTQYYRLRLREPLIIGNNYSDKVDIDVKVQGGRVASQTDAIRLAIATGLVEFANDKKLEDAYLDYDRKLLVADVRRKEPCKPNYSKARKKRQKSYR